MLYKILFVFILTQQFLGECAPGCLRCNADNQCLVCDLASFYILNNHTCERVTEDKTEFCQIIDFAGKCIFCRPGYYLSGTTNNCVIVETEKKDEHCLVYGSSQACIFCKESYRLEGGVCVVNQTNIAGCSR